MIKLQSLRAHLMAAVPALGSDPDRLLLFVEAGQIEAWKGQGLSHGYRADCRLTVLDWAGSLDEIVVPLLDWLAHYQPDLDPQRGLRFEAELLGTGAMDLSLVVTLTERVVVSREEVTGQLAADHRLPEYPAALSAPRLIEVWANGEPLAAWSALP